MRLNVIKQLAQVNVKRCAMNLKSYLPLSLVTIPIAVLILSASAVVFGQKPTVKVIDAGTFSSHFNVSSGRWENQGERIAFERLSSGLKHSPSITILRVKWRRAGLKGQSQGFELKYNRSLGTLNEMNYSTQRNPALVCLEVPESVIHLVAADENVVSGKHDWNYVVSRNGCKCENEVENFQ